MRIEITTSQSRQWYQRYTDLQRSPEEDRSLTWTETCKRLNVGLENDASHLHSSQIFDQNSPKEVKDKVKVEKAWGLGPFHSHLLPLEDSEVRKQPRAGSR